MWLWLGSSALAQKQSPLLCVDAQQRLDPDFAVDATYGSGYYQLRLLVFPSVFFITSFVFTQLSIFTFPKLAADPSAPLFTTDSVKACQTAVFAGWALGCVTITPLADKFGRWWMTYTFGILAVLAAACSTFATTFESVLPFCVALFMVGLCVSATNTTYLLVQESIPSRLRGNATVGFNLSYSCGLALMALICGTVTRDMNWRTETLLLTCPIMVLLIIGAPFVHESIHFLASQERWTEAWKVATAIAVTNEVQPLQHQHHTDLERIAYAAQNKVPPCEDHRARSSSLLEKPWLLNSIAASVCWVAVSVSYYGISFSAGNLSNDLYTNVALMALVDMLGYFLPLPLLALLGWRKSLQGSFIAAAICLVSCGVLIPGSQTLVAFALLGRLFADIAFNTVYTVGVNCFPAEIRSTAFGVSQAASRFCTIFAPLLGLMPVTLACPMLGVLCLIAAVAGGALTEVGGQGQSTQIYKRSTVE